MKAKRLTDRGVRNEKTPGFHQDTTRHLALQVTKTCRDDGEPTYGRSWAFIYKQRGPVNGKYRCKRYMGLGSLTDVSLEEARGKAHEFRKLLLSGVDPIEHRRTAKPAIARSFRFVAKTYWDTHRAGWRNPRHAQQWWNTMDADVFPAIGDMDITAIDTEAVLRVIETIWTTKPPTAARIRGRIEVTWDYAKARTWVSGENPARMKGNLADLLPKFGKLHKPSKQPSLPWEEVPALLRELEADGTMAAAALRFLILTGGRTDEVLGARSQEIDPVLAMWHVPAGRMKGDVAHKVPLSAGALAVLAALPSNHAPQSYVFTETGHKLGQNAMLDTLDRFGRTVTDDESGERRKITVHGFRTSLRMFGLDHGYPEIVCDMALAHKQSDRVKAAYTRGTLATQRQALMAQWSAHCCGS